MERIGLMFNHLIIFLFLATNMFAWHIQNTERQGDDLHHYVMCDNGRIIIVLENTYTNYFFNGSNMYDNFNEAVISNCNQKSSKKIIMLKDSSLICDSQKRIREHLAKGNEYLIKFLHIMGSTNKDDCRLVKPIEVTLIKQFKHERFDMINNIAGKDIYKTVDLVDSYYSIKINGEIFYTPTSNIKF